MLSGFAGSTIGSAGGCDESPVDEDDEPGEGEDNGKVERGPAPVVATAEPAGGQETERRREEDESQDSKSEVHPGLIGGGGLAPCPTRPHPHPPVNHNDNGLPSRRNA